MVSRPLLSLLIKHCLTDTDPLSLVIDETLARRSGPQIPYRSWFRDPIRSTVRQVQTTIGIRWICLALLAPVPWSTRLWALPFCTIPALAPATSAQQGKRHRTLDKVGGMAAHAGTTLAAGTCHHDHG